ncbi:MAG: LacI family transcriptional regulator [Methylobacillus sp.]|jgi:hypothetical protein|nr:LacI family transcriptional regulator [Methylobacillus sp.]
MSEQEWMNKLTDAVTRLGCAKVSEEITKATGKKISRSAISLVVNGKYPAKTNKIALMVINTYGRVRCPFLGDEITLAECSQHHNASTPISSPRAMRHWRACQGCEHRKKGDSDVA